MKDYEIQTGSSADRVLRIEQVMEKTTLGKSSILMKMKNDPAFPKSFKIGRRACGWSEHAIDQWIAGLKHQARRLPSPIPADCELVSCALHYRIIDGQPEVCISHGCDHGAAFITGKTDIKKVADFLAQVVRVSSFGENQQ